MGSIFMSSELWMKVLCCALCIGAGLNGGNGSGSENCTASLMECITDYIDMDMLESLINCTSLSPINCTAISNCEGNCSTEFNCSNEPFDRPNNCSTGFLINCTTESNSTNETTCNVTEPPTTSDASTTFDPSSISGTPTTSPTTFGAVTTTTIPPTSGTSERTTSNNDILTVLSDPPVYIGIAGAGLLIIIILVFVCIGICILCSKRKAAGSKKKKKPGNSAVTWSEGGQVQLLSIAEKAGVEDNHPPDAGQVKEPSTETEEAAAPKEEDKRVVTVSTFGFPEVSIQPPPSTTPPTEEEGKETVKKEAESIEENKPGDKGSSEHAVMEDTSLPAVVENGARDILTPTSADTVTRESAPDVSPMEPTQTEMRMGSAATAANGMDSLLAQVGSPEIQAPDIRPGNSQTQDPDIGPPLLQLGVDSSILSTEAIERALGITFNESSGSTQL